MRCSIFRSLPVLPPPPRKEPRGYFQPAFCLPSHAQLPDSSRRKAPRGLASLLFTGGRRASSPGGCSGSASERAPRSSGAAPSLLFSDSVPRECASLPRRLWSRQAECGAKGGPGPGPGPPPYSSGTSAGRLRPRDWTWGGIAPKCCQTDGILGPAILAWSLA